MTLAGLFAIQAERSPEADAVIFGSERFTYLELDRRSNRLARHLSGLGVGPGALVGVCLERSAGLIVTLLAILKTGAAYLPIDPASPAERLRWMLWMLADTGVRVAIDEGALDAAPPSLIRVRLDRLDLDRESAEPLAPVGTDGDLAYVMYTSGSTGLPKGVAIAQRGIVQRVMGTDYVSFGPEDRVLQAATPAFDASTFEIWGALLNCACLVILPREVCLAPRELAAALRRERITKMFLTTALFHQVAVEAPDSFRGMGDVFFGGETANPRLVRRVLESGGPGRLVHIYGPTEITVAATWYVVREVPAEALSVPIGWAMAHTEVRLVDEEILLGGAGLALGYWARPEATAEAFVPDPFSKTPGARLYRTGDLGAWRDGVLEFLGRKDRQVKIRGFRIEPGEIEAALSAHPAVRQAHVAVRPNAAGENHLVGYVVGEDLDRDELRSFLADRLPAHLVPSALVVIDALPVNFNGKLDFDRLPDPDRESAGLREPVAPRTEMEARVAEIWSELLKVETPGVDDDFFALGGHSLMAGRLVTRLLDELGVELSLRDVFDHPTLAAFAARVEEVMAGDSEDLRISN
ncbi:MAG TPA: non-ribosomal peptide synthetase [Thermoanaerobaculia bacterium]|jgi:amino acid adenylation domain-containing protein|nr:non-ribosomal peptide synthetase [Thermoanaerobaculia bacterium]